MSDQSEITCRTSRKVPCNTAWLRIPRRLSIVLAVGLSGCVPQSSDLQQRSDPAQFAVSQSRPEPHLCRPAAALLTTPHAPDCVFRRPASKAMDPDEFSRLKVEYELSCYQSAERAVRRRLRDLQAASKCLVASAR
jgi:hypothetical protein